jgi:hypothetical protein
MELLVNIKLCLQELYINVGSLRQSGIVNQPLASAIGYKLSLRFGLEHTCCISHGYWKQIPIMFRCGFISDLAPHFKRRAGLPSDVCTSDIRICMRGNLKVWI